MTSDRSSFDKYISQFIILYMNKTRVIIGFLGTKLDLAQSRTDRWAQWRPSVGICQQEDFIADRFELIHSGRNEKLLQQVVADIASVSPETEVRTHALKIRDPWDFEEVYAALEGVGFYRPSRQAVSA